MRWRGLKQELRARPVAVSALTSVAVVILVAGSFGAWRLLHGANSPSFGSLPSNVTGEARGFRVYWLKPSFSTDFVLQPATAHYDHHVLIFSMVNSIGTKLVFAEQPVPPHFDGSQLALDDVVATEFGRGYVVSTANYTAAAFISADNTWVTINAPHPIGQGLMQQFVQALEPLNP